MPVRALLAAIVFCALMGPAASAQTPASAPAPGYRLHAERTVDRFFVQQWVSAANPDVSPAGFCECIMVVYEAGRLVLNLGESAGIVSISTIADVTGDRRAELMVSSNSGGAHCCLTSSIYSVDVNAAPRPLLSLDTADCGGEVVDLDGNGIAEFRTCDPIFGYEFCSFAFSPFPPVVYSYDSGRGEFVLATPRYGRYLDLPSAADARKMVTEYPNEPEVARCAALGVGLGRVYTGRVTQGRRLLRQLYRATDAAEVIEKALTMARQSAMWTPR